MFGEVFGGGWKDGIGDGNVNANVNVGKKRRGEGRKY